MSDPCKYSQLFTNVEYFAQKSCEGVVKELLGRPLGLCGLGLAGQRWRHSCPIVKMTSWHFASKRGGLRCPPIQTYARPGLTWPDHVSFEAELNNPSAQLRFRSVQKSHREHPGERNESSVAQGVEASGLSWASQHGLTLHARQVLPASTV